MVGHPLDTIKVRIQSMEVVPGKAPQYTGMIDCAKQIVNKQGVKGLYSGMAGPLAGTDPHTCGPAALHRQLASFCEEKDSICATRVTL